MYFAITNVDNETSIKPISFYPIKKFVLFVCENALVWNNFALARWEPVGFDPKFCYDNKSYVTNPSASIANIGIHVLIRHLNQDEKDFSQFRKLGIGINLIAIYTKLKPCMALAIISASFALWKIPKVLLLL